MWLPATLLAKLSRQSHADDDHSSNHHGGDRLCRRSAGWPSSYYPKFSRGFEAQADLGIQYMYKAGYDPSAYIAFFERCKLRRRSRAQYQLFPLTANARPHREIAGRNFKILPPKQEYMVTSSGLTK
jgi:hypothetical protein